MAYQRRIPKKIERQMERESNMELKMVDKAFHDSGLPDSIISYVSNIEVSYNYLDSKPVWDTEKYSSFPKLNIETILKDVVYVQSLIKIENSESVIKSKILGYSLFLFPAAIVLITIIIKNYSLLWILLLSPICSVILANLYSYVFHDFQKSTKIIESLQYKNIIKLVEFKYLEAKYNTLIWKNFTWQEFEVAVGNRLNDLGLVAKNTDFSNDEGVDVILKTKKGISLIQCKKYSEKVGTPYVRNLIGSMKIKRVNRGVIITTGPGYSKPAVELANSNNILLLELVDFLAMNKEDFELI